jgi:fluoride ion exporter CrcB/FEX
MEFKSLEHVAPQKLLGYAGAVIPNWPPTFSSASLAVNWIGNLTLLSVALNAAIPEDTPRKQKHYQFLVSPGTSSGVTPTAAALMMQSPQLSHLIPVYLRLTHWLIEITMGTAPVLNAWDEAFIFRRASNIAEEAAKDLLKWMRPR